MNNRLDFVAPNGEPELEPPALPEPTRARWQPLRSGLLNLYRYDYEEFHYEDGHLLLRGNNGTGKSRVLALQLPFLFDGEVAPHRVEPDADPAKRMEWNLLLGKHNDRLGYTWIEFGRQDEDGEPHYLTLGCGLSAVAGRGLAGKWFFVTPQRIGRDLFLQAPTGQVLTRDRLIEALGRWGEVFTTAREYRLAVDRELFKLGEIRYNALLSLLIQLRQPQLSRNLDEKKLSAALSDALPPLSSHIITDVAESFRGLESDRVELEAFVEAQRGAELFLAEYRRYAQIAARRLAEHVRLAHSAYESTMRRLREAEAACEQARQRLEESEARVRQLDTDERSANAAVQTLQDSPAMHDARALDQARRLADDRQAEAKSAQDELERAVQRRADRQQQHQAAQRALADVQRQVQAAAGQAEARAGRAGLLSGHTQALRPLGLPQVQQPDAVAAVQSQLDQAALKQRHACRLIAQRNQQVERARSLLATAKEAYTDMQGQLDEALQRQRDAQTTLGRAAAALIESYRAWAAGVGELAPADPQHVADALEQWLESDHGASPMTDAVNEAKTAAVRRLTTLRDDCQRRVEALRAELAELRLEQQRLEAGHHQPPAPPYTRDPDGRQTRPGAPLWLLCDFLDPASGQQRAGIEAALEAAGLLDAWVTPEGRLLDAGQHDTILVAGTSPLPESDRCLDRILKPAVDRGDPRAAAVDDATVTAVLRHIGLGSGAGSVWVDADGRWQVGPLHGAWNKPAAQHIGQGAREADRRRRLEELAAEIAAAEQAMKQLRAEQDALAARERTLEAEVAAAPDDSPVRDALAAITAAAQVVDRLRPRLTSLEARVAQCRNELNEAVQRRDRDARDLGIADWIDNLQTLEDAIAAYQQALAGLWPTIEQEVSTRRQAEVAAQQADEAERDEQHRSELWHEAQNKAQEAAVTHQTLKQAVGAAVEDILARLQHARRQAAQYRQAKEQAVRQQSDLRVEQALADKNIQTENENLQQNTEQRQVAIDQLCGYAGTGLLAIALAELGEQDPAGWSVTRAVELARKIEAALADVESDDAAWRRMQKGIHRYIEELKNALLPYGYQPEVSMEEDVFVVTVPFQGRNCSMGELRDALAGEVATRQAVLDAREREVLENHLIGDVATHLHELLHSAEQLVAEMNEELKARPTSTGMTLRFRWRPVDDGPAGLPDARRRLLSAGGMWSPAEREALGEFLQQQIQAARAANETGTWLEHLTAALDYRGWHEFSIERQQDGQWKRLTRRTHGTGSGGEKAIALTVPQFAAAAAHYRTASEHAPRLILLDEAFVGVDADMRSKCMGLLAAFDLDFVMTSEREWGCYATLPSLAIYQLATRPGIDAVGITRWVWNGRERLRQDRLLAPSVRPPLPPDNGSHDG